MSTRSLKTATLDELYQQPKITPSVRKYIFLKEDFSTLRDEWCQKVCRVTEKCPPHDLVLQAAEPVDVLIISDFFPIGDQKYKKTKEQVTAQEDGIMRAIFSSALKGVTYQIITLQKCATNTAQKQLSSLDCSPYLFTQIESYKPKAIISLSTTVTKALGIKASNGADAGKVFLYKGVPTVLTFHPRILTMVRQNQSGAFWGADYLPLLQKDLDKAKRYALGELQYKSLEEGIEEVKGKITVCQTLSQIRALRDFLLASRSIISFDIETTGLDPFAADAAVLCIQFGYKDGGDYKSVVVPLFHPRVVPAYDPSEAWELLKPVLLSEVVKKTGHNVKFDAKYLAICMGLRVRGVIFDTMLLIHSLSSGIQGMYSLKTSVGYYMPETGLMGYEDRLKEVGYENDDD